MDSYVWSSLSLSAPSDLPLHLLLCIYILLDMLQAWLRRGPIDESARSIKMRMIGSGSRTKKGKNDNNNS